MRTSERSFGRLRWILPFVVALGLAACGSAKALPTPTLSIDAIFTSAAQTFEAQQATKVALTPPTATPVPPTDTPTLPPPSPFPTFSAFSTPTLATGGGSTCDNSAFVSDVTVPDGTVIDAGAKFVKTWLMQNTGTCPWTPGYKIVFVDGNNMGGASAFVNIQVPVGQQLKASVNLVAPSDPGSYYGRWQLQNEGGKSFGSIVTVVIKVGSPTATNTP